MDLFRKEVVRSFEERAIGRPVIASPLSTTIISYASLLIVALFFLVLFFGSYTRRVKVDGVVLPKGDVVRIYNNYSGLIERVHVKEGDVVSKGDILFTVVNDKVNNSESVKQETIKIINEKIESTRNSILNHDYLQKLKISTIKKNIISLEGELNITRSRLILVSERVSILERKLDNYKKLFSLKNISSSQLDVVELELIEAKINRNEAIAHESKLVGSIDVLNKQVVDIPIEMRQEKSLIEQDMIELQMRLLDAKSERENQILSPIDGTVSSINSFVGKNINRNFLLGVISPNSSPLEGVLYLPNKAIGFIKNGAVVKIRLDAFPYQKFGYIYGRVKHVSKIALLPGEIPEVLNTKELLFRVLVDLDSENVMVYGEKIPLRTSMTFSADIMLENRKLYEWVLEPLYSIAGKL